MNLVTKPWVSAGLTTLAAASMPVSSSCAEHLLLLFSSPGLQGTDGIDFCHVDDGSQGFQSSTAAFSNLSRQKNHTGISPSSSSSSPHLQPTTHMKVISTKRF